MFIVFCRQDWGRGRGDYSCHSKTAVASQSQEEADYLRERMTANKTPSWQILLPVEQTQNTSTSKAQTVVNVFCCSFFKMGVTVFKGRFKRLEFVLLYLLTFFELKVTFLTQNLMNSKRSRFLIIFLCLNQHGKKQCGLVKARKDSGWLNWEGNDILIKVFCP